MLKNAQRSTFNAQVSVQNLECGDKSRAVRGSRHRFPSALCAETHCALAQKASPPATTCLAVVGFIRRFAQIAQVFVLPAGWEGRASARPRASRRLPLPALREPVCRASESRAAFHRAGGDARAPDCVHTKHALDSHHPVAKRLSGGGWVILT